MKKKNLITGGLSVLILLTAYMLYNTLMSPIQFSREVDTRTNAIIEKFTNIRIAQRAYKAKFGNYTDSFQELIRFVENDSIAYEVAMGSLDDSTAVAEGLVSSQTVTMAARDTLFSGKKVDFRDIQSIPYTEGGKFSMGTAKVTTESGVEVTVFEVSVPLEVYLHDLDRQMVINLRDRKETELKFPGVRVGSLQKANNDAGSWEE